MQIQPLDIISVNIWQIIISLCNLVILFLIIKKFLFKPAKDLMAKREAQIAETYAAAKEAKSAAEEDRSKWDEKMLSADEEAEKIIKKAVVTADRRKDAIIAEAKDEADGILRQAEADAELTKKAAQESIKQEIVDVSAMLTSKMLSREINTEDHRELISEFMDQIGEES